MNDQLILVDENDAPIGTEEKLKAHQKGLLHRAISLFIFNSKGELMLQKRAKEKYHSGGLWSNTCCSHPRPNEETLAAAHRRLKEEMGFDCDMKEVYSFIYEVPFPNGLTEHEFDHVLVGVYDNEPILNREEAEDWKWIEPALLQKELKENPDSYTFWLKKCLNDVLAKK